MADSHIETATIMFVDVVGSTALRAKVGEEEAERLRMATDAIVNVAVEEHAGAVVKHLGDGAMAKFGGAGGAVDAAVLIQQQLERFNRRGAKESVQVRIGIAAGDVTVDDGDYFGLPVVEAQRLESSAEPATIRCADLVKQLSRGRGDHEFTDLGELTLKGLSEPLRAYEIGWAPAEEAGGAELDGLPPVLALAGGMPFSGRADVLQGLLDLAKRCAHGGFATAFIAGEPGIGKTRLTHELALRVVGDGFQVLAGRSDEDVTTSYQPVRMALDWAIGRLDDGDIDCLGRYPGDLARLLPDLAKRIGAVPPPLEADPEAEHYRLLQAVESWLVSTGARQPVLLVLDDLHWADKGTLVLLQHIIRSAPVGVFVVCTYRDTDVDRAHPLSAVLADLRRLPDVERILLGGLPPAEVREFLERAGGHALDETGEAFAGIVERETAGNPFFVSELLRHLVESGVMVREDGRWTGDLTAGAVQIPEGIREVVGRRLGRLGDEVEDVLRAASVIGYEFDVDLLAAVVDMPADDVIDALDEAVPANIVVEVGVNRFRFSHALVRETLHDELSSTRRARQHRKVAIAMEQLHGEDLGPVLPELATHWREATIGGDQRRAIELSVQVGGAAMESLDPHTAAAWLAAAVEMMEDNSDFDHLHRQVLVDLADAQIRSGDLGHRRTARDAAAMAIASHDVDTAVAALTLQWRTSFSEYDEADERKIEMLRTALAELDLDEVQRADLTGELASELIFTRDIAGRAAALAEFEARLALLPNDVRGRLRDFGRVSQRFHPDVVLRFEQTTDADVAVRLYTAMIRSDGELFDELHGEWLARIAEMDPFTIAKSLPWRVPVAVMRGDLQAASRIADELLELMRELQIAERPVYRATTALCIARELGTHTDLLPFWTAPAEGAHPSSATAATAAFLHLECGDRAAAATMLNEFSVDSVTDDAGYAMAVGLMSEVAATIGTDAQCEALLEPCREGAGFQVISGGIHLGSANRLAGLLLDRLGRHDDAAISLSAAIEDASRLRSPTWLARSQLDLATSRLTQRDTRAAAASVELAAAALEGFDLPASRARLGELEQRLGTAP
jgi:class 3 adenylate cyclase/DNA polymerase III delta prime subunit